MQATHEQLGSYLLWLKDRGLRFPASARKSAAPAPAKKQVQVAFVGDGPFKAEERDLLVKMITAMQLSGEHVILDRVDEFRTFQSTHDATLVIPLGSAAAAACEGDVVSQLRSGVCLPTLHPRDLLARPDDKRIAWNDLKRAMARLKA